MPRSWSSFVAFYSGGRLLIGAALLASLLAGCKGATSDMSRSKSLNNFARNSGDVSRNVCKGDQEVVMGIHSEWDHVDFSAVSADKIPALKDALRQSLSAVPDNLQQLYFGLGGKIVFSSTLNQPAKSSTELSCEHSASKDKFASEGTGSVEACWTIDSKTANPVVLMNPSVDSVHHATVRIFGYILSQILTKLGVENGNIVAQKDVEFEQLMSDIANAVVADIKRPGSKYTLAINESLISTSGFKYFAFAESFDSYYCNAGLRQSMAKADEFPKTYALFQRMDAQLRQFRIFPESTKKDKSGDFKLADNQQTFQLGIFGGLFQGLGGLLGRLGSGIFKGGAAIVGGAGRLLGGGIQGLLGNLLGGGGGEGGGGGGGIISMIMNLFSGGGGE